MDNVTHSLVGIALADLMSGAGAMKGERRLAVGAAVIASNVPDVDIVYAPITPAPLGYLLHHRGHTHTVAGIIALAVVLYAVYRRLPPVRKLATAARARLGALIAIALASHLLLDALNSYGIHPFYPRDRTWYYGDAVFIFEPWLWMLLGIGVAWNARGRIPRIAALFPIAVFPFVMASTGLIPPGAVVMLAAVGVPVAWGVRRRSPRLRAAIALAASAAAIGGFGLASNAARRATIAAVNPEIDGTLVDVVVTPNPAVFVCWSVIAIELDAPAARYTLWRGTLSLVPRWMPPTSCVSHRFSAARESRLLGGDALALTDRVPQSLDRLRRLARHDCWVRAWLQFGRAPVVTDHEIFDLRFAQPAGRRFTYMRVVPEGRACPANVPDWAMPRADLISR